MAHSSAPSPTTPSSPDDGTTSRRRRLCLLLSRMSLESRAMNAPALPSLNPDPAGVQPAAAQSFSISMPSDMADTDSPPSPGTHDRGAQRIASASLATIQADYLFGAAFDTEAPASPVDNLVGRRSANVLRPHNFPWDTPISLQQLPRRYRTFEQRQEYIEAIEAIRARTLNSTNPVDLADYTSAFIVQKETAKISDSIDQSARLRYLPLCPSTDRPASLDGTHISFTILPNHRNQLDTSPEGTTAGQVTWPGSKNSLPREIFDLIIISLSRDDVKSMRLVCREFEKKVSGALFHTAVVPFNTELYDMVDEDTKKFNRRSGTNTAFPAGPIYAIDPEAGGLSWHNAKHDSESKLYKGHGLRVFQGFGPHIKRFGMSFEVTEEQLAYPPIKKQFDRIDSFHGSYDWPRPLYTRFVNLAGLERIADDTMRMKAAFANLKAVSELGLSIDSGLGWLNGPDRSIRALVFDRPSPMFGRSGKCAPDRQQQDAANFWTALEQSHAAMNRPYSLTETSFACHHLLKPLSQLRDFPAQCAAIARWPSMLEKVINPFSLPNGRPSGSRLACLYTTHSSPGNVSRPAFDQTAVVPVDLRKEQKEWLLETEWAQRAFLECYVLAITDNPSVFRQVTNLNITKLSSGFLSVLAREQFWNALPSLTDVTILVKPDWRSVAKDVAGCAAVSSLNPSEAVRTFHHAMLFERICPSSTITKLNVGWNGGGEHAEGILARNNHLLPAPVTSLDESMALHPSALFFPRLEHLTLTNCWITPPTLESLVTAHAQSRLRTLVLDSVSLTAHPRAQLGGPIPNLGAVLNGDTFMANIQSLRHHRPMLGLAQRYRNLRQQHIGVPLPNPDLPLPHGPHPGVANPGHMPNAVDNDHSTNIFINHAHPHERVDPSDPGFHPPPDVPRWADHYRLGSWPNLLANLYVHPAVDPALANTTYFRWGSQPPPRPAPHLPTLEFRSCGYARFIHRPSFNQKPIEALDGINLHDDGGGPRGNNVISLDSYWFHTRHSVIRHAMLPPTDRYLARLVQVIPERELDAMIYRWGLVEGWTDRAASQAPEFDGHLPGGSGRFSGVVGCCLPRPLRWEV